MKTHRFDALSFLAGLVITGIGLTFLVLPDIDGIVDFLTNAGTWFWPVLFIAVGIAVLAPLVTPGGAGREEAGAADASRGLGAQRSVEGPDGDDEHEQAKDNRKGAPRDQKR